MEEENLSEKNPIETDPVEDLIKDLNKVRKSQISKASRLSRISVST